MIPARRLTRREPGEPGNDRPVAQAAGKGLFARIPTVRKVEPSVVAVLTDSGEGSGVVWRDRIVTNRHVVDAWRERSRSASPYRCRR